jgi:hypothetical protein
MLLRHLLLVTVTADRIGQGAVTRPGTSPTAGGQVCVPAGRPAVARGMRKAINPYRTRGAWRVPVERDQWPATDAGLINAWSAMIFIGPPRLLHIISISSPRRGLRLWGLTSYSGIA